MSNLEQHESLSDAALQKLFKTRCKKVEQFLASCLKERDIPTKLKDAMEYSLLAGGKRLRPVLCLTTAALANVQNEDAVLPFACAIELIHTYSLIHDDLPMMDNDDLRRGKPSNHIAFGEATALLAGDALLTDAFWLMTKAQVNAANLVQAIQELACAAGAQGMCAGQELDMELTGQKQIDLATLKHLHALKTGALLSAACTCGVLLSSNSQTLYNVIKTYGQELGVAFQIVDDILDVVSDEQTLGKPVHSDSVNDKTTYPSLCGIDQSRALAKSHSLNAQKSIANFHGQDHDLLVYLAKYIVERIN